MSTAVTPSDTIHRFYTAFQELDGDTMAACYAPDCRFSDPVFPELRGPEVGAMWQMLCKRAKGFSLEYSGVEASGRRGQAHWEARYVFSTTGRTVHNIIEARFEFNDSGLIVSHVDTFDLWRWTRQALGAPGVLLGWSGLVQNKVRATAAQGLEQWMARDAAG
jgi:limonene-1,2-epoxide hydrolase